MIEIFREMRKRLDAGESVALATVIEVKGSTPREAGAKMLVTSDGRIYGTIGGGCGEAEVWRSALDAIQAGGARVVTVDLTEDVDTSTRGAICGGTMDVFVEAIRPAGL